MNDDWKTLRVPPDAHAAAKEQKEAAGRTWGEQIVRPDGTVEVTPDPQLEALEQSLGNIDGRLEDIRDYVAGAESGDFPTADVKEAVREVLKEEFPEVVGR